MDEAGFIDAIDSSSHSDMYGKIPHNITWQGYEFLDLIRKDTNWNKAKEVMKNTGGMAFEILLKVLFEMAAKTVLSV